LPVVETHYLQSAHSHETYRSKDVLAHRSKTFTVIFTLENLLFLVIFVSFSFLNPTQNISHKNLWKKAGSLKSEEVLSLLDGLSGS
jgi:hypothetical protein